MIRRAPAAGTAATEAVPVVLVSELFPPAIGGSGVLLENVYRRLSGIPVTVLTHGASPRNPDEQHGALRILRLPLKASQWGILGASALRHHLRVAGYIRSACPGRRAIVYCARALPEGLAALLVRLAGGSRYVCWTHGEELGYACSSRELSFLLKRVHANADALIANSHNTAGLLERLGVPRSKIRVIYPGVDAERFRPSVPGAAALRRRIARDNELLLLSVGRLQRRKGHDLVVAALAILRDIQLPFRYVIVGGGDERPRLEALVRAHRLEDHVLFAGKVADEVLPAYYAACDIFVLPNRVERLDFEGFGIVFLEAAAAECPVIGGRSGGVSEAVEDGTTGILVSGTDAGELAAALKRLACSPDLRRRMGRAGRARVIEQFTWARAAAVLAEVHRELGGGS